MKKKHLVILRFSALGDIAITIPILRCLFATYPNIKVTFVSQKKAKDLFYEFPKLQFLAFDKKRKNKGIKGLWKLFLEIKALNPTIIIDLHSVLRTYILQILFNFYFIKFKQINKGRINKRKLTRYKNKIMQPLTPTIYRYADVFRKAKFPIDLEQHQFPPKPLLPNINILPINNSIKKWIGIAPFASFQGKVYPLNLMQKVISDLEKKHDIFLLGGNEKEIKQLNIWERNFSNVWNLSNKIDFKKQLFFISHLDLMLSMDSANAHFAANVKVPTVIIWGLTHPFLGFAPFLQPFKNNILSNRTLFSKIPTSVYGNKRPKGYEKAMQTISPKVIVDKIEKILHKNYTRK